MKEVGVPLALPPGLSVLVGEDDTVELKLSVVEPLSEPEGVPVCVHEAVPEPVFVAEPVGVPDGVMEDVGDEESDG